MSKLQSIRDNQKVSSIFYLVLFATFAISVILQLINAIFFAKDGLLRLVYFTIQSNILITVIMGIYILKKPVANWFTRLTFIGLVNISVTGIVFHILLTPYMSSVSFMQHMLHTINPLLFIIFYFIFFAQNIKLKEIWIVLISPLIYLIFVFGFVSPVLGNLMETQSGLTESARYVYPFLNPDNYNNGLPGMLLFNLGILAPSILILSIILQQIKRRYL
jgi:hypothetical protein